MGNSSCEYVVGDSIECSKLFLVSQGKTLLCTVVYSCFFFLHIRFHAFIVYLKFVVENGRNVRLHLYSSTETSMVHHTFNCRWLVNNCLKNFIKLIAETLSKFLLNYCHFWHFLCFFVKLEKVTRVRLFFASLLNLSGHIS